MTEKVLVLGGGGREHALAWKLAQSDSVSHVLVAPGNAGTANTGKISNVDAPGNFNDLARWCKDQSVNLVVVGPEAPLAAGVTDVLAASGVPCFGPSQKAAEIEASKAYAKDFMDKYKIPTAKWQSFTEIEPACEFIRSADFKALVVKASGLAAGKGVIVAKDQEEACAAVCDILQDKKFGAAGETVVIEELLDGEEVSVLAFSDGTNIACLPPAQDHKRAHDGDNGPNTGGMGAYCPYPNISQETLEEIKSEVIQKAVDGMRDEGRPYVGILYAGLMLTQNGIKTLEFNCRFGDPETQVVLPLLTSDLYATMRACTQGELLTALPSFCKDKSAVGVVLASGGYPGSYKKGCPIKGVAEAENEGLVIFHSGTSRKDGQLVTSGGRVLVSVAIGDGLEAASAKALQGAQMIAFEGAFCRTDIAKKGCDYLRKLRSLNYGMTYVDSGVSISEGNALVEAIKPLAALTSRPGCHATLGGFGGMFDLKAAGYADPLLVSGTDGVGTKLKIAQSCHKHNTIGQDLVAMCVNDILAHGAEALFFLDYFACGKLEKNVAREVVSGISQACLMAGCALLGGETAEMPGMYADGEYDVAGFAVGAVERSKLLPRIPEIQEGDAVIGVASSGVHSNGFSLVRRIVESEGLSYSDESPFYPGVSLGESLLVPTKIYAKSLLPVIQSGQVKAFAHITGGGLTENIPRILPKHLGVELDANLWEVPAVFGWLMQSGHIREGEMARTFNCGIGGVLVVSQEDAVGVVKAVKAEGEEAYHIGTVNQRIGDTNPVVVKDLSSSVMQSYSNGVPHFPAQSHKLKVGVLISGTGTNLQALIDYTQNPRNKCNAEIILVISNKPGVKGLERAQVAGIATKVIRHQDYKSRVSFDMAVHEVLKSAGVEFICLAGFMRILSGEFVKRWEGHLINIHPSLLPSFPGMHAHQLALEAGVRVSGCTVHFVVEKVDAGAILVQETVPVFPNDTVDSLQERVKTAEHVAYPRALSVIANGEASYGNDGKVEWK